MPITVLIAETASAPASCAPIPIDTISETLGLNFIINKRSVLFLNSDVSSAVIDLSTPNSIPPFFTLGHDIFISNPTRSDETDSIFSIISTYSFKSIPATFMIILVETFL